jgi:hypothetical protein
LFAHRYKDQLRYDFGQQRWLIWATHWWVEDRREMVVQMAKEAARLRYRLRPGVSDDEEAKQEARWARASESRRGLEATLKIAKSELLLYLWRSVER